MSLVELFLASANSGGVPGPIRPNPAAQAALDDASDRETEAALESRVRAGKALTPSQAEVLAEIRANRVGAAPAITITTPAAVVAPMAKVNTPPIATPSTSVSPPVLAGTPDAWRAEFAASPELQREFGSIDLWLTYQQGIAAGRIHHHGGPHRRA